jgi:hypothetical protein
MKAAVALSEMRPGISSSWSFVLGSSNFEEKNVNFRKKIKFKKKLKLEKKLKFCKKNENF